MKKVFIFIMLCIISLIVPSCDNSEEAKADFDVSVEFSFAKDGDKKEFFDSNVFETKTRIYVCVDFEITKNIDAEETLSFVVQIPYAEYYTTKEYYAGTIKPKENLQYGQDSHGNEYTIMELSQMNFILDDKETHDFHYIFEIEAKQACEDASFIVRFKPQNTNLTVCVNKVERQNTAIATYTFISREVNDE